MRKLLIAILALPVLAAVYTSTALGRSGLVRAGVAVALGGVLALGTITLARPTLTTATAPTEIVPLTQAAFSMAIGTKVDVGAPASLRFSTPMQRESVASAIRVEPAADVTLRWSADDTVLEIRPTTHWAAGTYYTVTVQAGALARTGRPTTGPARAAFLTRPPATAVVTPMAAVGKRVAIDSGFLITFDSPVDTASLDGAVRLDPPVAGTLTAAASIGGTVSYRFVPVAALKADTRYRLTLAGVRDRDGVEVAPVSMAMRTSVAPAVVRFRPRAKTDDVDRDAAISVRFTQRMDRQSTKAAFKVTVDGKAVRGTVSFAEGDTVLVFDPASTLPYGAKVVATVAGSASSADGAALGSAVSAAFRTIPKPAPAAPVRTTGTGDTGGGGGGGGGGGSVGSGSWASVERYYLGLMNCTRTGGIVTSSGGCSSPGGRSVAALRLDSGISSKVSRPYARKLAVNNICSHFSGGNPGDRLRRAGYTSYRWAENLGCRSGKPTSAVLGSHLYFQSERSWSPPGGHYVNLMNSQYDRVGIGVWVSSGRVRLVVDFYHP
ncbi:MAG TPA: Ig-like domain-containing protein [Candidatus Limnocylindrales bacterium]|nr:Ig-like domain-containing protein [Candidatus Limnocylindrales bacterium]